MNALIDTAGKKQIKIYTNCYKNACSVNFYCHKRHTCVIYVMPDRVFMNLDTNEQCCKNVCIKEFYPMFKSIAGEYWKCV